VADFALSERDWLRARATLSSRMETLFSQVAWHGLVDWKEKSMRVFAVVGAVDPHSPCLVSSSGTSWLL
jgi:hypothetical protein